MQRKREKRKPAFMVASDEERFRNSAKRSEKSQDAESSLAQLRLLQGLNPPLCLCVCEKENRREEVAGNRDYVLGFEFAGSLSWLECFYKHRRRSLELRPLSGLCSEAGLQVLRSTTQ